MLTTPSGRQWLKSQPIYSLTALVATMIWHSVLLSARLSNAIIRPLKMAQNRLFWHFCALKLRFRQFARTVLMRWSN
jgi:hypothetical protein